MKHLQFHSKQINSGILIFSHCTFHTDVKFCFYLYHVKNHDCGKDINNFFFKFYIFKISCLKILNSENVEKSHIHLPVVKIWRKGLLAKINIWSSDWNLVSIYKNLGRVNWFLIQLGSKREKFIIF